jgi:hypothetical protein
MKQEEIQKKGMEKNKAIETLCKQLEVEITAKQIVTERGFIETVVMFVDLEKYELDKEEEKKDEKTPNLRGQNPEA